MTTPAASDAARASRAEDKTARRARNRIQWRIAQLTRASDELREEVPHMIAIGEGLGSVGTEALEAIRTDLAQLIAALKGDTNSSTTARALT